MNVHHGRSAMELRTTLLFICLALLTACAPVAPQPVASVTTDRPDTQVQVGESGDSAVVDVVSPTGIGGAQVALAAPPGALTVRLHLSGLEEYRFGYDDAQVLLSVSSHDASVRQSVRVGEGSEEEIEPGSPYWMDVRILDAGGAVTTTLPLHGGVIEVDAPPDFFAQPRQTFSLSWIDFYR